MQGTNFCWRDSVLHGHEQQGAVIVEWLCVGDGGVSDAHADTVTGFEVLDTLEHSLISMSFVLENRGGVATVST